MTNNYFDNQIESTGVAGLRPRHSWLAHRRAYVAACREASRTLRKRYGLTLVKGVRQNDSHRR